MKITKRTIDSYIIDSLFSKGGTYDEQTALKKAIEDCNSKGIDYTMSAYVRKIHNN